MSANPKVTVMDHPHNFADNQPRLDAEGHPSPSIDADNDPYQLASKLKSSSDFDAIRAKESRKRDGIGPIKLDKDAYKARKLRKFYEAQNENIERLLMPVEEHLRIARKFQGDNQLKYKIAVRGSFAANIILAILQVYAAASSGSLSLLTTMADALFDPLSNLTLILSNRAVKKVNPRRFPSGKARIETVGNIVFCFVMNAVSWILIVVSILEIAQHSPSDGQTNEFHLISTIVVAVAFCTKLALFCYCWALRNVYSQVRILWEDHRNDLMINGVGIATSVLGAKVRWWIDPMGSLILSVLISFLWLRTAYKEFQLLIGVTADTDFLQWVTYIAATHSQVIKAIDTVRAYHSGPRLIVEVDIVIDRNENVGDAHDVAESLQVKLESLPLVERCFVHIDYETDHRPEHFLHKEL